MRPVTDSKPACVDEMFASPATQPLVIMQIFGFPTELVEHIFEAIAYSRDLKRFMRLRLVSRQFKYFVDDAIFHLRLLDIPSVDVGFKTSSCRLDHWRAYVVEYLAYQAWFEKEPTSLRGRIRRAAVTISELIGDTEQNAIKARVKSLCRLALGNRSWPCPDHPLFHAPTWPYPPGSSKEELEDDLCVAAVYLGYRPYIENLISQGHEFSYLGVSSDVFGEIYGAATFKGDVSMLQLLMSTNPEYKQSQHLGSSLQRHILQGAAIFGHKDLFDFALDSRPIILDAGEREDSRRHPEYEYLRDAITSTRYPENYERGASMFIPTSKISKPSRRGGQLARLTRKADAGHAAMVQYLLRNVSWLNRDTRPNRLTSDYNRYKPLVAAVRGGNPEVIRLLLDHGADPNWGPAVDTALMAAARYSRLSMARMLLEAGAKVNEGYPPPIVLSVFKEDMDMFHLLRQYGARLDTPETGNWAMTMAEFYGLESMVGVLVWEGVERGAVLHRCPGRREIYQSSYLFPQRLLEDEEIWLNSMEDDD
ncbi:ankyrin repeat-containing domain protein [Hypoxylon sp. FL0890]|nr:ankyrin repeat-containing domain protein [Hypoxylon sp. FL0890]